MKGIVGRKLGMTQVFDEETGSVEAVTVIEAGPCPVVTLRTQAADGYDAVQLAFEPVVDRKLSKGELGHLRKAGVNGRRWFVVYGGPRGLQVGESVSVGSFGPGDRV
jgi:large subunit ribosomal protein L3